MLVTQGFVTGRYHRILKAFPEGMRRAAAGLPYRLGLVDSEDGTWEDYTQVRFAYDLPGVVLPHCQAFLAEEELERYRMLHLHVATLFLIEDRVADGDIATDSILASISDKFREASVVLSLSMAGREGGRMFESCHDGWSAAVGEEQRAIRAEYQSLAEYGRIAKAKNRYLALATRMHPAFRKGAADDLSRLMDGMLTALQCRSDAVCHRQDRQSLGYDFPRLLGCTGGFLFAVSMKLMAGLSSFAQKCGFGDVVDAIDECRKQRFPDLGDDEQKMSKPSVAMGTLCVFPDLGKMV